MITLDLARRLAHAAGVLWVPASGDRFVIDEELLSHDVFWISNLTVEPQTFGEQTVLGFNGTTEWALDSVSLDQALWLPREDQLRDLLGGTFRSLGRSATGEFAVVIEIPSQPARSFIADDPAEAYAAALLALIRAAR